MALGALATPGPIMTPGVGFRWLPLWALGSCEPSPYGCSHTDAMIHIFDVEEANTLLVRTGAVRARRGVVQGSTNSKCMEECMGMHYFDSWTIVR